MWRRAFFLVRTPPVPSPASVPAAGATKSAKAPGNASASSGDMAQVLTPILEAAVRQATGWSSAGATGLNQRSSGAPALPAGAVNAGVRLLVDALVRPGSLSRPVRRVVATVAVGAAFGTAASFLGASGWVLAVLAGLVMAAAMLVADVGAPVGASDSASDRGARGAVGGVRGAATRAETNAAVSASDGALDSAVGGGVGPVQSAGDGAADTGSVLVNGSGNGLRTWFRYTLIGACFTLSAGLLAFVWYQRQTARPTPAAVSAYLVANLAPLPVKVAALSASYTGQKTGCTVIYQAVIETTGPLFRRVETAGWLHAQMPAEADAITAAQALLRGPNGAQIRTAVSASAPTPDVTDLVLLTTQTPPGATVALSGTLLAWRKDGTWAFTPQSGTLDRARFAGEVKPAGATFAVDQPADVARLKTLLAAHAAYAAQVMAAAGTMTAQLARERTQRVDQLNQQIAPGTLFSGTATIPNRDDRIPFTLEITGSGASTRQVSALLRNDGGWTDARAYRGDWAPANTGDTGTLTLTTRAADRIVDAGPLLQDAGDRKLVIEVRADGTAAVTNATWTLTRLDPTAAATAKADRLRPFAPLLAATKTGLVYRGTGTRRSTTSSGPSTYDVRLRITQQDADGALLRATLESPTTAGWTRPYSGLIIADTYRAGDAPIRLRSTDSQRARQADAKSPFGWNTNNDSLQLQLRVEGDQLAGQDAYFTYTFAAEDPAAETAVPSASDIRPNGKLYQAPAAFSQPENPAAPTTTNATGTAATAPISASQLSTRSATSATTPAPTASSAAPISASQLSASQLSTRSATSATTASVLPATRTSLPATSAETLQTANKVVKAVRDVKAAVNSSGSFFDRMLATASAALNAAPKPDKNASPPPPPKDTATAPRKADN